MRGPYPGLGERSICPFSQAGEAPRVVALALFWLTRWGGASISAQALNDTLRACGYVEALRQEVERLEGRVAYLPSFANSERIGATHRSRT